MYHGDDLVCALCCLLLLLLLCCYYIVHDSLVLPADGASAADAAIYHYGHTSSSYDG